MQKIQNEIRTVDAGILAAVRQQVLKSLQLASNDSIDFVLFRQFRALMPPILWFQSNSGTKAKEDLAAATRAVEVWHVWSSLYCLFSCFYVLNLCVALYAFYLHIPLVNAGTYV